ncbi:class I SAM-dependent methyltransferase [Streptomyces cylindrosporus]|uniref:Class I SAM-dependent methyltransferase n=1 Tax=Streptomyces cylindrosporus TaxID=2927583 RepID=A0ABS9YM16_9ACTN|nr:class I SAM-dependent methyltransferase [Streptomyces cylindrosporus]MCI3278269.1 class I SAM-dependent methyltransferase [Streptomyces cylindrosporus]
MTDSPREFYDGLAADYHRIFPDWDASMSHQAAVLDGLLTRGLGPGPHRVLDCACGIGTQAIGLARTGHRVVGADLSPVAVTRAAAEAATRGAVLPTVAADMRQLPFRPGSFDAVVCADNALPHLLTVQDVTTALTAMRRVLRADGLLLLSVRDYDEARRTRPAATPPQVSYDSDGRTITFQLWHWHDDGERYDLEHFQLLPGALPGAPEWSVQVRRTTYWALTRAELSEAATAAGFTSPAWHEPPISGFHQPLLTARAG